MSVLGRIKPVFKAPGETSGGKSATDDLDFDPKKGYPDGLLITEDDLRGQEGYFTPTGGAAGRFIVRQETTVDMSKIVRDSPHELLPISAHKPIPHEEGGLYQSRNTPHYARMPVPQDEPGLYRSQHALVDRTDLHQP